MKPFTPTEDQIRTQFVTSLMNYFKIEEDVFLRSHIDELIRPLQTNLYKEFLHRLSSREFAYKTGIEKISTIAHELYSEQCSPLERQAQERAGKLYILMYDLRRVIVEQRDEKKSALERFENVAFTSLRPSVHGEPFLDSVDIDAVRILTKRWIYDTIALDRGIFDARVTQTYLELLIKQERLSRQPLIAPKTRKMVKRS
jgi:hypothetical protein